MSLNRDEVNALGVLGFRKLTFIPEHFAKISIDAQPDLKMLEFWIEYNLNSRYAIQSGFTIDANNKMVHAVEVGVEDPKELTLLTLGCPYLYKKKELF